MIVKLNCGCVVSRFADSDGIQDTTIEYCKEHSYLTVNRKKKVSMFFVTQNMKKSKLIEVIKQSRKMISGEDK